MSYIVKRSDGSVWAQSPDHPAYFWYKDVKPAIYKTFEEAERVRKRIHIFHAPKGLTIKVEKYDG